MKLFLISFFQKSFIALLYTAIVHVVIKGCPIYVLLGYKCPTCGMTRAYLFLLHGDWKNAFSEHPLFMLVPLLWIFICIEKKPNRCRSWVFIGISLVFFMRWFYSLLYGQ